MRTEHFQIYTRRATWKMWVLLWIAVSIETKVWVGGPVRFYSYFRILSLQKQLFFSPNIYVKRRGVHNDSPTPWCHFCKIWRVSLELCAQDSKVTAFGLTKRVTSTRDTELRSVILCCLWPRKSLTDTLRMNRHLKLIHHVMLCSFINYMEVSKI